MLHHQEFPVLERLLLHFLLLLLNQLTRFEYLWHTDTCYYGTDPKRISTSSVQNSIEDELKASEPNTSETTIQKHVELSSW